MYITTYIQQFIHKFTIKHCTKLELNNQGKTMRTKTEIFFSKINPSNSDTISNTQKLTWLAISDTHKNQLVQMNTKTTSNLVLFVLPKYYKHN